jgi:ABC-type oligopeptide transport system substrate-binding subunit
VSAGNVLRDLYEGLITEAPDGQLRPGTADHWTVTDDGRIYRFHVRSDARWSNGDPVVAADFVAGMQRSLNPASGSRSAEVLYPIDHAEAVHLGQTEASALGVRALSDDTLEVRLSAPLNNFPARLTNAVAYPLHRASHERWGDQFTQPGHLISNGAYYLLARRLQSSIVLEKSPHYWDAGRVAISRVDYQVTEDLDAEYRRFIAGELDVTEAVPAPEARAARARGDERLRTHRYLGSYFYGLNLERAPFAEQPKLRQALNMAIDREVLVGKVLGNGEQAAYGIVPPGIAGYEPVAPDWAGWPRRQRVEMAQALYRQAGYGPETPLSIELRFNTQDDHRRIATAVAAMWRQFLGVRTQLVNEEWKVFLQTRSARRITQVFRAGWIADENDPLDFLRLLLPAAVRNDTGYRSTTYAQAVEQAAESADSEQRRVWLAAAEGQLQQDAPVLPLYFYVSKHLVSPRVQGWQGNVLDHHLSRDLWLTAEH